jgi:hypothetical protein
MGDASGRAVEEGEVGGKFKVGWGGAQVREAHKQVIRGQRIHNQ